ncbi:hypothetical protein TWF788_008919 [Orbilia oligospora]|uniref:Uncharacterized protein n=1 Tax=Orbilia oligospora TaxID=2813651 RepID=A0A7C8PLW8_ORBOL|nr:hypothetical protein TWF788_008919 [Orbilia oligospora]
MDNGPCKGEEDMLVSLRGFVSQVMAGYGGYCQRIVLGITRRATAGYEPMMKISIPVASASGVMQAAVASIAGAIRTTHEETFWDVEYS